MKAAKNLIAILFDLAQNRTNPLQPIYTEVSVEALALFLFFVREGSQKKKKKTIKLQFELLIGVNDRCHLW